MQQRRRRSVVARALLCRHRALTNAPAEAAYIGQEGQGPAGGRARGLNPSRAPVPQPDVMTSVATMKSKFSRCLDPDGSAFVVPEKWSL